MKNYNDYKRFAEQILNENNQIEYINQTSDEDNFLAGKNILEGYKCKKQISFTPYIYNECSANCQFCSEHLVRQGKAMVCKDICDNYIDKLNNILENLKEISVFLSLSGKEPTESLSFVENVLAAVAIFENTGGEISSKVMYSNLSGVVNNLDKVKQLIEEYNINRIECSRHHFDEEINQSIMRFKQQKIKENIIFENIIKKLSAMVEIKLVCVIQRGGIDTFDKVCRYLDWARTIGVKQVVFRELAMFDKTVDRNTTATYIVNNRIELMDILKKLDNNFKLDRITSGYYYMSFAYLYQGMNVWFEMSDYEEMNKIHESDKVYKLIYYPNGKLCLDWNMKREIY